MGHANEAPDSAAGWDRAAAPLRTVAALVSAWLLPGAGHAVLGRMRRGILFAAIVLGSFGLGVAHDGWFALQSDREPFLSTMRVVANVGVGPLDAVARSAVYGAPVYRIRRVGDQRLEGLYRDRLRSPYSNYGTAYLWTAGLMNLLLLFDVWDIARGRKP